MDITINLENKRAFYFKKTNENIKVIKEDGIDYRDNITCRCCEKNFDLDKVIGHCHLTGKCRGPAHKET